MANSLRFNAHLEHVASDETDAAISFIKDISRSVDTGAFALLANVAVFALVSLFTTSSAETGSKQA